MIMLPPRPPQFARLEDEDLPPRTKSFLNRTQTMNQRKLEKFVQSGVFELFMGPIVMLLGLTVLACAALSIQANPKPDTPCQRRKEALSSQDEDPCIRIEVVFGALLGIAPFIGGNLVFVQAAYWNVGRSPSRLLVATFSAGALSGIAASLTKSEFWSLMACIAGGWFLAFAAHEGGSRLRAWTEGRKISSARDFYSCTLEMVKHAPLVAADPPPVNELQARLYSRDSSIGLTERFAGVFMIILGNCLIAPLLASINDNEEQASLARLTLDIMIVIGFTGLFFGISLIFLVAAYRSFRLLIGPLLQSGLAFCALGFVFGIYGNAGEALDVYTSAIRGWSLGLIVFEVYQWSQTGVRGGLQMHEDDSLELEELLEKYEDQIDELFDDEDAGKDGSTQAAAPQDQATEDQATGKDEVTKSV